MANFGMTNFDLLMELEASDYHSPTWKHVLVTTNQKAKVPWKEKTHWPLVEYIQLNTLVAMYNLHFGHYSKGSKCGMEEHICCIQIRVFELYLRWNTKRSIARNIWRNWKQGHPTRMTLTKLLFIVMMF